MPARPANVRLEAVPEKNADLPAAVNRARFVQEVASGKIQAGNSKIRVIESIQEFFWHLGNLCQWC